MTIAIIQIVFGLFFLGEVCMRIFGGIIITFIYTVVGAVLTYRGIVGLI